MNVWREALIFLVVFLMGMGAEYALTPASTPPAHSSSLTYEDQRSLYSLGYAASYNALVTYDENRALNVKGVVTCPQPSSGNRN
jgi:hypothetical protein